MVSVEGTGVTDITEGLSVKVVDDGRLTLLGCSTKVSPLVGIVVVAEPEGGTVIVVGGVLETVVGVSIELPVVGTVVIGPSLIIGTGDVTVPAGPVGMGVPIKSPVVGILGALEMLEGARDTTVGTVSLIRADGLKVSTVVGL